MSTVAEPVTTQPDIDQLLTELREALREIYGDRLCGLYLYGSYANDEADAESDVDLAIVLRDFQDYWTEVQRTSSVISDLSLKYDVSISPVRLKEEAWLQEDSPFLNIVRKEALLA